MAIVIKHSGNASSTLVGAYGGGQGQRQAQDARQAMDLADRERSRAVAARQAQLSRQHQAAMAAQEARRQQKAIEEARQFQIGREELRHEWDVETRDAMTAQRFDEMAFQSQQRRDDFVFQLTTQQKAELDKLANAEAEVMASSDYSDEEKKVLRKEFAMKRAGLQPVERLKPKTPAEKFAESTYTDPRTGKIYGLNPDGSIGKAIHEPPAKEMTWKDVDEILTSASNFATGEDGLVDQKRFDEYIERAEKLRERFNGRQQQDGAAVEQSNPWVFGDGGASAGASAGNAGRASPWTGSVDPIANFPTDIWGKMSDEDRADAWTLFRSGRYNIGQIVSMARRIY